MSICSVSQTASAVIAGPSSSLSAVQGSFVRRQGTSLQLDGRTARFAGANVYWLGLDENDPAYTTAYPSEERVLESMATVVAMGGNAIRCTTCGVSVGCALCMENALGEFNEAAMRRVDFALYAAQQYGLRLIVPLTDQYDYFHGGIPSFLRWRNLSDTDFSLFYDTSSPVYADFELYVRTLLTRNNTLTSVRWGDDPTILAWETGNELGSWHRDSIPPVEWTMSIARLIRSLAPNTLIIDGTYGLNEAAMSIPEIDIVSNHFYPTYGSRIHKDATLAGKYDKAYLIGEYDWTDRFQRYSLLGALIPVIIALIVLVLPGRWFPLVLRLPRQRKRKTSAYASLATPLSPLPDSKVSLPPTPSLVLATEPILPSSPIRPQRTLLVRKWHISLLIVLIFVPVAIVAAWFSGPTSLGPFLNTATDSSAVGTFYWSLFGRSSDCCSFVEHNDGYTLHWPGTDDNMRSRSYKLADHARRMTGLALPPGARDAGDVGVTCPQVNSR